MNNIKDFDFWEDGIGLIHLISIYLSISFIVLKVLGMVQWSWLTVLSPCVGFLIIITLRLLQLLIEYKKKADIKREFS